MKRIISALMTLLMLLSMLACISFSASADYTAVDTATADDAVTDYSIASVSDLIWAAKNYAVFAEGDTLYLTADLDISQYDGDFAADFPGFGGSADANQYDYAIMIGDYNHKAQLMVDILDHKAFMALNGGLDFETAVNTFSSAEPTSAIDNIIVSRKLSYYWNHDTNVGVETSLQPYISDHNCLYTWIKLPA